MPTLEGFASETGIHGISTIVFARSKPIRAFWIVIAILAMSGLIYQIADLTEIFLKYETG